MDGTKEESDMNSSSNRSMLYGIVGGYLIYLAYELGKNMADNVPTTMPRWLNILAVVAFAVIGVVLLVSAWKIWKKSREDKDENPVDLDAQEDGAKNEESGSEK